LNNYGHNKGGLYQDPAWVSTNENHLGVIFHAFDSGSRIETLTWIQAVHSPFAFTDEHPPSLGTPLTPLEQFENGQTSALYPYLISLNSQQQITVSYTVPVPGGDPIVIPVQVGAFATISNNVNWSININAPDPEQYIDWANSGTLTPYIQDQMIHLAYVIYHQSILMTPMAPTNIGARMIKNSFVFEPSPENQDVPTPCVTEFSPSVLLMTPQVNPSLQFVAKAPDGVKTVNKNYTFEWVNRVVQGNTSTANDFALVALNNTDVLQEIQELEVLTDGTPSPYSTDLVALGVVQVETRVATTSSQFSAGYQPLLTPEQFWPSYHLETFRLFVLQTNSEKGSRLP
jgi:hypothetical protein